MTIIVGTLAVGPRYVALAQSLLAALQAAGCMTLAVTDTPGAFPAAICIPWTPDDAHVWHAKRHVLRAGLERAETVVFLDADHELLGPPQIPQWPRGGYAQFMPRPLRCTALPGTGPLDAPVPAAWLDAAGQALGIDWRRAMWWGDSRFAISGGREALSFCNAWDHFAAWTVRRPTAHPLLSGDGIALALAARAVDLPVKLAPFDEILPVRHLGIGEWRKLGGGSVWMKQVTQKGNRHGSPTRQSSN